MRAYAANREWIRNQLPPSRRETRRFERSSSASDGGGARAVERGVAELCGELAERRDAVEKRPLLLVERREDLAAQVLGHEALVAVEGPHGGGRVGDRPQQEAGKHERRRPALGLLAQQFELVRPELDLAAGDQQLARLGAGERELARP